MLVRNCEHNPLYAHFSPAFSSKGAAVAIGMDLNKTAHGTVLSELSYQRCMLVYRYNQIAALDDGPRSPSLFDSINASAPREGPTEGNPNNHSLENVLAVSQNVEKKDGTINIIINALRLKLFISVPACDC